MDPMDQLPAQGRNITDCELDTDCPLAMLCFWAEHPFYPAELLEANITSYCGCDAWFAFAAGPQGDCLALSRASVFAAVWYTLHLFPLCAVPIVVVCADLRAIWVYSSKHPKRAALRDEATRAVLLPLLLQLVGLLCRVIVHSVNLFHVLRPGVFQVESSGAKEWYYLSVFTVSDNVQFLCILLVATNVCFVWIATAASASHRAGRNAMRRVRIAQRLVYTAEFAYVLVFSVLSALVMWDLAAQVGSGLFLVLVVLYWYSYKALSGIFRDHIPRNSQSTSREATVALARLQRLRRDMRVLTALMTFAGALGFTATYLHGTFQATDEDVDFAGISGGDWGPRRLYWSDEVANIADDLVVLSTTWYVHNAVAERWGSSLPLYLCGCRFGRWSSSTIAATGGASTPLPSKASKGHNVPTRLPLHEDSVAPGSSAVSMVAQQQGADAMCELEENAIPEGE